MINSKTLDWLISSDPWTSYMVRKDILGETYTDLERRRQISEILSEPRVSMLLNDLKQYFPYVAKSHTDAKLSHYKLRMLSDFGLKKQDGLEGIIDAVKRRTDGYMYAIRQQKPLKDGAEHGEWHALPCDSPLLTYTLMKLGDNDGLREKQIGYLTDMWRTEKGWFCHLPFVNGQFKREQIGCPMAGLQALECFSLSDALKESVYAQNAFQTLAHHYALGRSIYYFGRGKRFFTFKYPFVWYNALYMAEVLSRFEFAKKHDMMTQLVDWIKSGQSEDGKYMATSMYVEYKNWDFGNKKAASQWITFLCYRILKRFNT